MIDINIKGVYTASPQPCLSSASRALDITKPNQAVYSTTKFAVRAISEGLRQEAGDKLRVTIVSPGFVQPNFAESVKNPEVKAQITASMDLCDSTGCNRPRHCVRDRTAS